MSRKVHLEVEDGKQVKRVSYKTQPGPIERRSCRDILFLFIFAVFWFGMFFIAATAVRYGDPNKIIVPLDSTGNYCGVNNLLSTSLGNITKYDLSLKPNLMYLNPITFEVSASICIAECPTDTVIASFSSQNYCTYAANPQNALEFVNDVALGTCAAYVAQSISILNRCIPVNPLPSSLISQLGSQNITVNGSLTSANDVLNKAKTISSQVFADLVKTWPYIVGGIVASMVICFTWIYLMRWFAAVFVWLFIIAANLVLVGLSIYLYFLWQQKLALYNATPDNLKLDIQTWEVKGVMAAFIISCVIAAVVVPVTIYIRKSIKIAIEIVRLASKSISAMPIVLIIPLIQWIGLSGLAAYFIFILLYIVSSASSIVLSSQISSVTLQDPNMNLYLIIYHTFGFFWGWSFIFGIGQVTIAAAYYFTMDKSHLPRLPVLRSFYRTIRYHLGSIAIGSLLIAIVRIIRVFLWYVNKRAKGTANNIAAIRWVLTCLSCFMACIDKLVNWINKNAYIHIAVNGTSFCVSAGSASKLIIRNAMRLLAVDFVSEYVLFLGKIAVAAGVFFASWAIIQTQQSTLQLNFTFVPAIIIALESLIVSYIFLSVYHMTIDTIFLCFLEDCERNTGSDESPYYMPEKLMELIDRKSAKKAEKRRIKD